jgi:hypothetical protein
MSAELVKTHLLLQTEFVLPGDTTVVAKAAMTAAGTQQLPVAAVEQAISGRPLAIYLPDWLSLVAAAAELAVKLQQAVGADIHPALMASRQIVMERAALEEPNSQVE